MAKLLSGFMLFLMISLPAWAGVAGQVVYLSGTLSVKNPHGASRLLARQSSFSSGEILSTAQGSFARLKFVDGTEIAMRPNTALNVRDVSFMEGNPAGDTFTVGLLKGGMRSVTGLIGKRNKEKIRYETPVATIGVRGTHFGALYCKSERNDKNVNDCKDLRSDKGTPLRSGLHADVAQGSIELSNEGGSLILGEGSFGYVENESTVPVSADADEPFSLKFPASVMFDTDAQVWGGNCMAGNCTAR